MSHKYRSQRDRPAGGVFFLLLVYLLLCTVTAGHCTAPNETRPAQKKIIAVIPPDFPPTYFRDEASGQAAGFSVDVMNEVARRAGFTVEYIFAESWDLMEQAVLSEKADLVPNLTIDERRLKSLIFTAPVETLKISLIARASDTVHNSIESGMKIGVMKGSSVDHFLSKRDDITRHPYPGLQQLLLDLLAGRVDLAMTAAPNMLKLARDADIEERIRIIEPCEYEAKRGMALRPGNEALRDQLNSVINEFVATLAYQKLYQKWWGKPVPFWSIRRVASTIAAGVAVLIAIFLVLRILERRRSGEELRKSEERHRTILQTAMDGFWMVGMTGRLLDVNETYCRMSGYSADELLTLRVPDLEAVEMADETADHIRRIMARGMDRFESRHRRKDGSVFDVEVSAQHQPSEDGWLVAFIRDITERKQTEAHLQQTQKLESIGTLAGGIAHDFNNILFPLVGFAELLKEDIPSDSPLQSHIDQIICAALRSKDLVKQILAFSRKSGQSAIPVQLHPLIKEALNLLRASIPSTIEIQKDIDSDCGIVMADPTQLHQIVMNLATNAYHAMEDTGGRLHVGLKQIELTSASDPSVLPALTPGKYALLTVSDTGAGIDKAILHKIFDPYFTTKGVGKGSGLGLSVVQGIVKAHKGDIRVFSEPGKGTEVYVYLPILAQPFENKSVENSQPVRGGQEKILLVDDDAVIVDMIREMLVRLGYQVEARFGSIEALEAFRENPDAFDLVLTDMTMPKMTGAQLARALISIRPGIPIIVCTGFSENIDSEKAKASGIEGFLMKPVVKSELAQLVRKVLDEATAMKRKI